MLSEKPLDMPPLKTAAAELTALQPNMLLYWDKHHCAVCRHQ